jgi:branched-subunit amino acid ABC-type transport system permease component
MDASLLIAQFMSGLSRGMMLFLIASGLSLIFGVLNILNFAHASLWLVGAYLCYSFWYLLQGYAFGLWLSIALAALVLAAIGWIIEVALIRRVYERGLPEQLLLTYAMVLIIGDLIKRTWGVDDKLIARPPLVAAPVFIFGMPFDSYFIFVILVGFCVAIGLWWFLQKTRYGHIVRAAVFSREMVSAGAVQAPVGSITLGMDMAIIIQAFCVVVIGGFGSLLGTLVGSLIVGEVYSFSILFWPQGALVLIFVVTAVVLIVRPWGLFGTPMRV